MLTRRRVLEALGLGAASACLPPVTFASSESDARFVLILLRGALDGLALAPPYGDGNYAGMRGELALAPPAEPDGVLKLDGLFGLHPSLPGVYELYRRREALVVHAVASPYRERSHFDGQDLLEIGTGRPGALRDGWLNRALGPLAAADTPAVALAPNTPLVLRGDNTVTTWAPSRLPDAEESTLRRLEALYADDEFFATRLEQALTSRAVAAAAEGMTDGRRRGNEARQFTELMSAAARFLTAAGGPTVAVLELGGWDTHANQGAATGALANRLKALDAGIANLRDGLGEHWQRTVVAVVTEFGRTVRVNGTRGTDHGTGAAALLAGGAVNGGRVVCDWPGLAQKELYENRDLYPSLDVRGLFKSILVEHLGLAPAFVEQSVFPDSRKARPLENLVSV